MKTALILTALLLSIQWKSNFSVISNHESVNFIVKELDNYSFLDRNADDTIFIRINQTKGIFEDFIFAKDSVLYWSGDTPCDNSPATNICLLVFKNKKENEYTFNLTNGSVTKGSFQLFESKGELEIRGLTYYKLW